MYKVGQEECDAVNEVILSKNYFRYRGKGYPTITSECEKEWAKYLKSPYTLLTTSGTNSLVVGMAAFGIGPGDEVIIPSYTFVATASAIMQVGAIPIIANIDKTLTIDPEEVLKKITPKTKAVVAVHMDGLICNLERLSEICKEKNLLLVEDSAQACGGLYRGKPVGTIGAFGGFSFNMDKVISCGEGGLLVIGDKDYKTEAKKALMFHDTACQYGQTYKEELSEFPPQFGLSTRLNEINSAMLSVQLKRLPEILNELRKTKNELIEFLNEKGKKLHLGHDQEGDIGSNIHLICSDPMDAIEKSKHFLKVGIKAGPPYLRPAHACWNWFKAMSPDHYFVEGLNPYRLTNDKYIYKKEDHLNTFQLLSECIRVEINPFDLDDFSEKFKEIVDKF